MSGRTVITYLIDGDPSGAQYRFIDKKGSCWMYIIPRTKLEVVNEFSELDAPALYILLGETMDSKPMAYIGQAESFKNRVKQHNSGPNSKDFWQKAIVFVSPSKSINKADVEYLEHLAIKTAKNVGSYNTDENKNVPAEPHLPPHQKAPMVEFFEEVVFLTSFFGCRLFEQKKKQEKQNVFTAKGKNCLSYGYFGDDGFVVLKGSHIEETLVKSCPIEKKRDAILASYASLTSDGYYILDTDLPPMAPSAAATICLGRNANGWIEWKNDKGQTLSDVYRKDK